MSFSVEFELHGRAVYVDDVETGDMHPHRMGLVTTMEQGATERSFVLGYLIGYAITHPLLRKAAGLGEKFTPVELPPSLAYCQAVMTTWDNNGVADPYPGAEKLRHTGWAYDYHASAAIVAAGTTALGDILMATPVPVLAVPENAGKLSVVRRVMTIDSHSF